MPLDAEVVVTPPHSAEKVAVSDLRARRSARASQFYFVTVNILVLQETIDDCLLKQIALDGLRNGVVADTANQQSHQEIHAHPQ